MTKSQINKLGDKLRQTKELDAHTVSQLQQFRASYDEPMFTVQTLLDKMGLEATSRLKTINTIIEKLRRERTRLAEMQDIGGLRITLAVDLAGQDVIVARIAEAFTTARVIDRRKTPNHGYRAVHLIVTFGERRIEIQVRTHLQDLWAQAMERLADEASRQIRYGGPPDARTEDVQLLLGVADVIAGTEDNMLHLKRLTAGLPKPNRAPSIQRELRLRFAEVQSLRARLYKQEESIKDLVRRIIAGGNT